ncbi:unnamed protein product, partial [Polarella glacialis]
MAAEQFSAPASPSPSCGSRASARDWSANAGAVENNSPPPAVLLGSGPAPPSVPRPQSAGPGVGRSRSYSGRRLAGAQQRGGQERPPHHGRGTFGSSGHCHGTPRGQGARPPKPTTAASPPAANLSGAGASKRAAAAVSALTAASGVGGDALSALMVAVLRIYEHRTSADVWSWLLEPLRALVPCEEVKIVVRCLGPPPQESFPQTEARQRVKALTFVERWPTMRIEGHAATTQRIQVMPSQEAVRQHWDKWEVPHCHCSGSSCVTSCSPSASLRCLAAVPLFDANGNVLAVAKLLNRRTPGGQGQWHPSLEFSRADLTILSAFSAIFACVAPHPFLGLPGAGILRRPQAHLVYGDKAVKAIVQWQLPVELRGPLCHEVLYGPQEHDDEFCGRAGPGRGPPPREKWQLLPCGLLEPSAVGFGGESDCGDDSSDYFR